MLKVLQRLVRTNGDAVCIVLAEDGFSHDHNPVSRQGTQALSLEREKARRKVENTATELWYFINAKMKELASASGAGLVNTLVKNIQSDLQGYQT